MRKFVIRLSAMLLSAVLLCATSYAAEDEDTASTEELTAAAVAEKLTAAELVEKPVTAEDASETETETDLHDPDENGTAGEPESDSVVEATDEGEDFVTDEDEEPDKDSSEADITQAISETADWGIIYPDAEIGTFTESALTAGFVEVFLGYAFTDGSFDTWYAMPGFSVNQNTVVTSDRILVESPENERYLSILNSREEGYRNVGIDLSDYESVVKDIQYRIYCGGILIPAGVIAHENGLLVLDVSAKLSDVYKFSNEKAAFDDTVYAIGALDSIVSSNRQIGRTNILEQHVTVSSISADGTIRFALGSHECFIGGPLVSETGAVLGIVTNTEDGNGESITEEMIRKTLDGINRSYEIGEKRILADYSSLQAVVSECEAIEESGYTKESFSSLNTALNEARLIIRQNDRYLDQGVIDSAVGKIRSAINNLSPVEQKKSRLPLVLGIAGAVILTAALGAFLLVKLGKRPKEDDYELINDRRNPLQKALSSFRGKRAFVGEKHDTKKRSIGKETSKKPLETAKEKEQAGVPFEADDETSTLLVDERALRLLRKTTGEIITVNTFPFIVGHSAKSANFVLEEKTVSRRHFMIGKGSDGSFFIRDMKSTNGTALNGVRMEPEKDEALTKEDVILIPGEEFQVLEVAS